ncbi:hypothetical protein [Paenibacillus ginsengihumi]|uniref:hypothetical protein n=1 Tax=Paenibacillus ginsengihumi TaxID=431596 RepID=UPI00035C8D89|nr:hypothetical protein [Paenibacillus ginsengihumi]
MNKILISGIVSSGKTTLAKRLSEAVSYDVDCIHDLLDIKSSGLGSGRQILVGESRNNVYR